MPWTAAVGETLQDGAAGTVPTAEVRETAAFVGLYFSAHWCPRGAPPDRTVSPVVVSCCESAVKCVIGQHGCICMLMR